MFPTVILNFLLRFASPHRRRYSFLPSFLTYILSPTHLGSSVIWTKTCHFTFLSCSLLALCPKINTLTYQGIKYSPSLLQVNRQIVGLCYKTAYILPISRREKANSRCCNPGAIIKSIMTAFSLKCASGLLFGHTSLLSALYNGTDEHFYSVFHLFSQKPVI
jgi:hypothetical protein